MTPVILEVILGILLLVYLVAALVREIRRLQRQRMRVRKLYASPVFQDMHAGTRPKTAFGAGSGG